MKQTVQTFFKRFPDDESCLNHLFETRFGQGHTCSKCEKSAKWYRIKAERAYSCQWCGHHLHPTVGTPFAKSRTSLQLWFFAIFLFTKSRNGVSGKELQRQLGVTYKTAWRMGHEIRKHMANVDGDTPLGGSGKTVQIDETFIGGYKKGGHGGKGKAIVMAMIEEDGDVVTEVIKSRALMDIMPTVMENVLPNTEIHTDELPAYNGIKRVDMNYTHKTVEHVSKEYVGRDGQTTNTAEGFFMHLKRTIKGTHIWVSQKHLSKYAGECEFMYNRRNRPESHLTDLLTVFPDLPLTA